VLFVLFFFFFFFFFFLFIFFFGLVRIGFKYQRITAIGSHMTFGNV